MVQQYIPTLNRENTDCVQSINFLPIMSSGCLYMADVALLWFECKNPNCGFIPFKNKKEKIKGAWRHGESIEKYSRARMFMRYIEGNYHYRYNNDFIQFECKYGMITMYDINEDKPANSFYYPIKDKEECGVCIRKRNNEGALYAKSL